MLKEINNKANKGFNNKRDISRSDLAHMVTNLRKELKDQIEENKKLEKKVDGLVTVIDLIKEYLYTHKLYSFKYDDEELFEVTTDKKAKDDLLEILERVNEE